MKNAKITHLNQRNIDCLDWFQDNYIRYFDHKFGNLKERNLFLPNQINFEIRFEEGNLHCSFIFMFLKLKAIAKPVISMRNLMSKSIFSPMQLLILNTISFFDFLYENFGKISGSEKVRITTRCPFKLAVQKRRENFGS